MQVADIQKLMPDEFNRKLKEWELMKISSPGNERLGIHVEIPCNWGNKNFIRFRLNRLQILPEAIFGLVVLDGGPAHRRRRRRRRQEKEGSRPQEEEQQQWRERLRQACG